MREYPTGEVFSNHIPEIDAAELVYTGGQKAVYKTTTGRQVIALKVVAMPSVTEDSSEDDIANIDFAAARAEREVAILKQVDVPVLTRLGPVGLGIVTIGLTRWLYFTEEWIEGQSLQELISEGALPPDLVVRLGVDLIQAACWFAQRGIVHRDIKPTNIMWADDRSRFVLLDPGIAFDQSGPSLTQFPRVVGTMAYLSPEQTERPLRRFLDFRSDLFAIGIVLYEAAVSEHPFRSTDSTMSEVLAGILTQTPQPVSDRLEDFPSELSTLISRLLGKSPHLRYRRCEFALEAIEQIATSLGVDV